MWHLFPLAGTVPVHQILHLVSSEVILWANMCFQVIWPTYACIFYQIVQKKCEKKCKIQKCEIFSFHCSTSLKPGFSTYCILLPDFIACVDSVSHLADIAELSEYRYSSQVHNHTAFILPLVNGRHTTLYLRLSIYRQVTYIHYHTEVWENKLYFYVGRLIIWRSFSVVCAEVKYM